MSYATRRQSDRRGMLIANEGHRIGAESVIDIGAHDGTIARRLATDGFEITAYDRQPRPGVVAMTVTRDNVTTLGRADVVLALSVLHHMTDWREVLHGLRHVARKALIVEVPHPREKLRRAKARDELLKLHDAVFLAASHTIGTAPAVHDPRLSRELCVVPPLVDGVVFSGGGNHAKTQRRYGDLFEQALGYRPFEGSLNLRLSDPPDLGEPQMELRPAPGRAYQLWAARIEDTHGHLMTPDRAHENTLEMLAPVNLRDALGLNDGDNVEVEVVW